MWAQCCVLVVLLLLVLLVLIRARFRYFWTDVFYLKDLVLVLARFLYRKRLRPLYLPVDRFLEQVARHPAKTFVVFEDRKFTYSDADRCSNRIAHALLTHSPVRPGHTVALYLSNEPDFVFTWLALAKLGCPAALLNEQIRARSLLHCFRSSPAQVLITSSELQRAVEEILVPLCEDGVCVLVMSSECVSTHMQSLTDKMKNVPDSRVPRSLRAHVTFSDPATYIYTSGTTGLPKAAVLNQLRLLAALTVLPSNGVTGDDVIYVTLPLYHTAGFLIGFMSCVETGATMILKRKFSASHFWKDCRKHNVTVIQYIGEIMRYLCNTPKTECDTDHCVRLAVGNGLRADVWREFLSRFGQIEIREFYASTEGNVGFVNYTGKIGALGRVNFLHSVLFPYALIKYDTDKDEPVRDPNGWCVRAAKGETGLLVVKITKLAPFVGYAGSPEQTERKRLRDVFQQRDVYFNSGDLMKILEDNFIYFQDRVGDTFRWKGENVATTEVCDIITQVEFIKEGNVYGVQVPGHEGRIGMAAVTIREGAEFDGAKLFNHVKKHLPSYAHPRFIRIQSSVEVTGTFKQVKMKLVKEGFNPAGVSEPLYFLSDQEHSYIPLTQAIYNCVITGQIRL